MARTKGANAIKDDSFYMRTISREAEKSVDSNVGLPFAAIVVKDDVIIGRGRDTTIQKPYITSHCVLQAINNAQKSAGPEDVIGGTVYTTVEPCPMCYGACLQAGVAKIIYTNVDSSLVGKDYTQQRLGQIKVPEYEVDNYESKYVIFKYLKSKNLI